MNFDFTDEQKAIKAEIGRMLAQSCSLAAVRSVLEGEQAGYHHALWRQLGELGWLAAAIPEQYGGLGLGPVLLCGIAEELGRVLAPVPMASSIFQAAEAVLALGSEAQKETWLPRLGSGGSIGTLALWEGPGPLQPDIAATVRDGRLHGIKWPVADGGAADLAIVAAHDGDDIGLFVVELDQPSVQREPLAGIDPCRPCARLVFDGADAQPLPDGRGRAAVQHVLDRAAIFTAFEQVGAAERALGEAVAYARLRHAFGRPIGAFQAIKHRLADVYIQIELAKSNAYYGAWALFAGNTELALAAAAARLSATRAFEQAARDMVHVHGGFGMTWESDCHLFYRRARLQAVALGASADWGARLVDLVEAEAA